jgi:metal-dependent hydrolase (beta-lactamase superfamily II)
MVEWDNRILLVRGWNDGMIGEVHTGIYRLRLPVPGALRSINSFLLKGREGWSVIDAGPPLPKCKEQWETAIEDLGIQFTDIKQILITHGHIDHVGLAGWLQEKSGAKVIMTEDEYKQAFYPDETEQVGSLYYQDGMLSLGIKAEEIEQMTAILRFATVIPEPWPEVQFLEEKAKKGLLLMTLMIFVCTSSVLAASTSSETETLASIQEITKMIDVKRAIIQVIMISLLIISVYKIINSTK